MIRQNFSIFVKEIGMILWTLFFILLAYSFLLNVLNWALQYRWLFPFVAIPLIGLLVILGFQDLKSPEAKGFPIRKGLAIFLLTILVAALGFGAISLWLATLGWAEYASDHLDLFTYNGYYLWQFFDMIPLLKVNDTIGFVAPLRPAGFVAGLPVLAFRVLVLFGLLKALKEWWSSRSEKVES